MVLCGTSQGREKAALGPLGRHDLGAGRAGAANWVEKDGGKVLMPPGNSGSAALLHCSRSGRRAVRRDQFGHRRSEDYLGEDNQWL